MKLTITQSERYPTQYTVADSPPLVPVHEQVHFSGYFGTHGPSVYAAGPALLEALERLSYISRAIDANLTRGEAIIMSDAWAKARESIALAKGEVK